eukprot:6199101-Pleurochrysis_carterae.AAC.1
MSSQLTRTACTSQVFVAKRLLDNGGPPLEVTASQEELAAGLMVKIGHDSIDKITVATTSNNAIRKFAVPTAVIASNVLDLAYGDAPIIYVLANYMGNAAYVQFATYRGERRETPRTKPGMHRPLWFERLGIPKLRAYISPVGYIPSSHFEIPYVQPGARRHLQPEHRPEIRPSLHWKIRISR